MRKNIVSFVIHEEESGKTSIILLVFAIKAEIWIIHEPKWSSVNLKLNSSLQDVAGILSSSIYVRLAASKCIID